jgi:hypothetical protein
MVGSGVKELEESRVSSAIAELSHLTGDGMGWGTEMIVSPAVCKGRMTV